MLRANPRVLGGALFSALGLLPLACGGAFQGQDGGDAGGGSGDSAGTTHGGSSSTAGKPSTAGSSSGGSISHAGTSSGGSGHAGTGSGGTRSGEGGEGGEGGGNGYPCLDPMEVGAGYEQCANGSVHRPTIKQCESKLPRPVAKILPPTEGACTSDTDCADMPHGYCTSGGQLPGAVCAYGCVNDSECGEGSICQCGDPVGRCVSATCTSDAQCGAGLRCQSYDESAGCDFIHFACQTPQDSCGGNADCAALGGGFCSLENGAFSCVNFGCAIGRPFLVQGDERVAPLSRRPDWLSELSLSRDVAALPNDLRERAAQAWARVGQMEHASVAAFARFALQLLQLGAPPSLVELTTQAMADETRHARLAFALASAHAGTKLGPGPLDVQHSLEETSLEDVVRLVVREGCIGETCAALEAREAAEHAQDPALAELLRGVADDEARHAELAWRFVSWALTQSPGPVARVLTRELEDAEAAATSVPSADEQLLLAHGIVPDGLRAALRNATLAEVVRPCGAALLARAGAASHENPVVSG